MRKMLPSSWARRHWAWVALSAASTATSGLGCGATCDSSIEGNPPVLFTGGTTQSGVYESSGWDGPFLHFPGGQQYQLEHHLGFTPASIQIDFAFGAKDQEHSPCAGNSCVQHCIDSQIIWIRNDSCTEFWIHVTASEPSSTDLGSQCTGGALDAGIPDSSEEAGALEAAPEASPENAGDSAAETTTFDDAALAE